MPIAASAVAQAGAQIAGTIAGISDMNKRREFEASLGRLSQDQRVALEKQLQRTTDRNTKLQILANAVSNVRAAQAAQKEKSTLYTGLLVIGGGLVVLVAIYLIKKA